MSHRTLMLVSLIIAATCAPAFGDWTYNPSTGHWYQLTAPGLTWTQAEQAAAKFAGHLVTINDSAENDWILAQFGTGQLYLWIGLYQLPGSPEPATGWVWVSGEPITFTHWGNGEPNENSPDEDFGEILGALVTNPGPGWWNDSRDSFPLNAGIVEREVDPAVPTVSEWGLVVMTLLTLAAGTIILVRPRLARA